MAKSNPTAENHLGFTNLFDHRHAEDVCNLAIGAPGQKDLIKINDIFEKSSQKLVEKTRSDNKEIGGEGTIFQYGPSWGHEPYIQQLSDFLSEEYGCKVNGNNLFLTSGATSGLWLASTVLLPPANGVIFMESPSYFIAQNILEKSLGHKIVYVPMCDDGSGVDTELLEKIVHDTFSKLNPQIEKNKFWAMFYTVPTFHNPTGSVLSQSKSRKVIEISRKYDFLVFCDDVYNLLYYCKESIHRLYYYDNLDDPDYKGNVISNGSFSKILGPGFRIGWLEIPNRLFCPIEQSGMVQSGGSMNNVMAGIISASLELGLQQKHLQYLRQKYTKSMTLVYEVLNQNLPPGFKCNRPKGGYFMWISGPETQFNAEHFSKWCLENFKVQILPGGVCGPTPTCSSSFRICFAHYESDNLKKATQLLCQALHKYLA